MQPATCSATPRPPPPLSIGPPKTRARVADAAGRVAAGIAPRGAARPECTSRPGVNFPQMNGRGPGEGRPEGNGGTGGRGCRAGCPAERAVSDAVMRRVCACDGLCLCALVWSMCRVRERFFAVKSLA
eukprot:361144-Chlamydomonas_euryale.AAC.4